MFHRVQRYEQLRIDHMSKTEVCDELENQYFEHIIKSDLVCARHNIAA